MKKILHVLLALFVFCSFIPNDVNGEDTESTVKISVETLNVRSGPGLEHSIISKVHKGNSYKVNQKENKWLQIHLSDNNMGWIAGWFAKEMQPSENSFITATVDELLVRTGPGQSFSAIGYINTGQSYQVLKQEGQWIKIQYGNSKGWVAGWFTNATTQTPDEQDNPSSSQQQDKTEVSQTSNTLKAKVNVPVLNVRSGPGTEHMEMGELSEGETIFIIQESKGWVQFTYKGKTAWVSKKYIEIIKEEPKSSSSTTSNEKVKRARVMATILNIRNSPNLTANVTGKLKQNSIVSITKTKQKWSYIKQDDLEGWVAGWFLEIIEASSEEKASSQNNSQERLSITLLYNGTNIRSGPSTNDQVIKRGNKGDKFSVIEKVSNWYKIKLPNKKEAYVAGWIVKASDPSQQITQDKMSQYLQGKIIVVDPGHGGRDGGTLGTTYETEEKDLNLEVGRLLASKLHAAGAKVVLTRDKDRYISLPFRVNVAHHYKADAFISVHFNANNDPDVNGIMTFYYSKNKDLGLAKAIHKEVIKGTGLNDLNTRFGNFHVLRTNHQPSVLLELGFLSNPKEELYLTSEQYTDKAAQSIFIGLAKYFKEKE